MSYSTTNPPSLISSPVGGGPGQFWMYYTTSDAIATVCGSSYFSNGHALGMVEGDFMKIIDNSSSTALQSDAVVTAVTTGAGATVTATLTAT